MNKSIIDQMGITDMSSDSKHCFHLSSSVVVTVAKNEESIKCLTHKLYCVKLLFHDVPNMLSDFENTSL